MLIVALDVATTAIFVLKLNHNLAGRGNLIAPEQHRLEGLKHEG
jgi:hypothetical protein